MAKHINYICAFCSKDIESGDITALSVAVANLWNPNVGQGFAIHGGCLEERLHPTVPFIAEALSD